MPSLFSVVLEGVVASIAFLLKHPFVLKMMIFVIFTGLVASALTFIFLMVKPYMINNSIIALASYLGVIQAINLYLTIIIAGFGTKQVLAFVRST